MKSNHRTHFLFVEPEYKPSLTPIEDELTEKVDFIFAQLSPTMAYRGFHVTPFGECGGCWDYTHAVFPIVSNSLAPYYIRHHREDVSEKEINWINELYQILKNADSYYTFSEKPVYFLKMYENDPAGYGNALSYAVKVVGTVEGVKNLLKNTFFKELTEQEFDAEIANAPNQFEHQSEGCASVLVFDVLKFPL